MAQLSFKQVEDLWIAAGGDPGWAPLMAGIAQMESGLNTQAVNPNSSTQDYSVGLWQINYYGYLRESRTARYGTPEELLADPMKQARAAVDLFGSNGVGLKSGWGGGDNINNADIMYRVWAAKGAPQKPDEETILGWLRSINVTPRYAAGDYTIPEPGSGSYAPGSGGAVEGATTVESEKSGCNKGSKGSELPLVSGRIGSACQLKALTGGLLVGVGVVLVVTGAVLVAMNTSTGKKAVNTASGLIPGGGLIKSFAGSNGTPKLPRINAETRAESRANFDARNPSPERQNATRKARSGNLGARSFTMDDLAEMF